MMIKVNGEYLDFFGSVDIERKAKLFEEIESVDGDLSFSFDVELTSRNLTILGIPVPDSISKTVYQAQNTVIENDEGIFVNSGSLRIERIFGRTASCSFFGGNSNWFAMLTGDMTELRLDAYDEDLNQANIISGFSRTEGITYPIIDSGILVTRSYFNLKTEDFVGCFFLHTLFKETFRQCGLKIEGELLNEWLYRNSLIVTNTRNTDEVDNRTSYAGNTIDQSLSLLVFDKVVLDNDSTGDFFDGSQDNFSTTLYRYTADNIMVVDVVGTMTISGNPSALYIYKNGIEVDQVIIPSNSSGTLSKTYQLQAGDYIELFATAAFLGGSTITNATMRVTPRFVYKTTGVGAVPLWTKQEFVSNIMRLFNVLPSYDQFTKTVTLNLFDKITEKEPIDLSEFITVDTIDYAEFISNYGQKNNFIYQESEDENLRVYNISNFAKYGSGVIEVDNDFIEKEVDVLESDFTAPISYVNNVFDVSMERINFVELDEEDEQDVTSVTDSSGTPRFNITNADTFFVANDLVRIEMEDDQYDGDYVVTSVTTTYIVVNGLGFSTSSTGTVRKMFHKLTSDDNVYLFATTGSRSASDMFGKSSFYLNQGAITTGSLAFFNMLTNGRAIEADYPQGLSFGNVNNMLSFQRTLLDKYWVLFSRILQDPIKLICSAYLPGKVYNQLNFLSPVTIRSLSTSNKYYMNKNQNYQGRSKTCVVELIKLP